MTDYDFRTAFGSGPATSQNDVGQQYTLAMAWDTTAGPLWLKGYAFWRPDDGGSPAVTGPIPVRTWESVSGTAVPGSDATFTLSGSGYQVVTLPTPVPITSGVNYRSGAHFPNGRYPATVEFWGTGPGGGGLTVGPLRALNRSAALDGKQGLLAVGSSLAFPNTGSSNASSFWVTPILTDQDPSAGTPSGAVAHPVVVSGVVAGAKRALGAAAGTIGLSGSLLGVHRAVGAVSAPVVVSGSVAGQNPAQAPHSAVLCSAWATVADIPQEIRDEIAITDAQWATPLMIASEVLWMLSGRRWYGAGCQEEAYLRSTPPRPGTQSWPYHTSWGECSCWSRATWINGYPVAPFVGPWQHVAGAYAVRLPRDVITSVVAVTVNGQSFTSYTITRSGWLERLDGQAWDLCGGDTVITYRFGEPPPLAGVHAAAMLAVELARDMHNVGECRLPQRVTSITRQGVTVDIADSLDILKDGGTGITTVDLWLRAVNPEARPQRAGVWSPDVPRLMLRRTL